SSGGHGKAGGPVRVLEVADQLQHGGGRRRPPGAGAAGRGRPLLDRATTQGRWPECRRPPVGRRPHHGHDGARVHPPGTGASIWGRGLAPGRRNHPNMPWDGAELWVGGLDDRGALGRVEQVAGGQTESLFQPEWSPDGTLIFVSDRTGFWNLYRWRASKVEAVTQLEAEFGTPQW